VARHWWGGRKDDTQERAAIVGPVQTYAYRGVGQPQYADWGAEGAIKQAYLTNTVVYACVRTIAETIASLPFRAGRDPLQPQKFSPDAPLARLLGPPPGGPNPDTSPSSFMANYVAQRLVTGRYGAEIEWSGKPGASQVVALWPLVAQYLNPIPSSSGSQYFSGFEYLINSVPKKLSPERCYYDWQPSLGDWRQPESPLQAARLDISVAVMQDIYDKAFLQNDAKPAHMVVHAAFAEQAEEDAWREQFEATYGGPQNAGKTAFTPVADGEAKGALEVITLGMSQVDADFFRRYEQKVKGICIALGVPMSKLDASGRTFDNAAQEDKAFYMNTILPLVTKIQESINIRLAPLVGREVGWFELDGIEALQEPLKFQQVSPIDAYKERLITQNEARRAFGLDATDGGDDFAEKPEPPAIPAVPDPAALPAATDTVPAPKDEPVVASARVLSPPVVSRAIEDFQPQGTDSTRSPAPLPALSNAGGEEHGDDPADPSSAVKPPLASVDHAIRREQQWRSVDKQLVSMESIWERRFRTLFAEQERKTIERFEGKRGRQALRAVTDNPVNGSFDAATVYDVEGWQQVTASESGLLYEAVVAQSAGRMIDRFGIDFNIEAPYIQDFILQRANQLAGQVTNTTYRAIQEQLLEGVIEGEGIDQLATRIRAVFSEASKNRATTIARTEVISASNASTHLVGMEYPDDVVAGFEWLSAHDSRVREHHRTADGQQRRKGEAFNVGHITMRFPGDPSGGASEVINCRCTITALLPEDFEQRSTQAAMYRRVDEVERELVLLATRKFNPHQPRDEDGKWKGIGGGGGSSKIPSISDFQAHQKMVVEQIARAIQGGQETDKKYDHVKGQEGIYKAKRARQHVAIVNELYAKADKVPSNKQSLIAGGLGGAGKSTTLKKVPELKQSDYLTLNPDDVKELMAKKGMSPKVDGLSPMEASALMHEESSHITALLAQRAMQDGKNITWDITMASEKSIQKRLDDLHAAGYDVDMVFVDIPLETSVDRALARYKRGQESFEKGDGLGGRYVPPEVIKANADPEFGSKNLRTFQHLKKHARRAWLYDNSGSEPVLVEKRVPSEL
jgi:HK97 family phage portal protein